MTRPVITRQTSFCCSTHPFRVLFAPALFAAKNLFPDANSFFSDLSDNSDDSFNGRWNQFSDYWNSDRDWDHMQRQSNPFDSENHYRVIRDPVGRQYDLVVQNIAGREVIRNWLLPEGIADNVNEQKPESSNSVSPFEHQPKQPETPLAILDLPGLIQSGQYAGQVVVSLPSAGLQPIQYACTIPGRSDSLAQQQEQATPASAVAPASTAVWTTTTQQQEPLTTVAPYHYQVIQQQQLPPGRGILTPTQVPMSAPAVQSTQQLTGPVQREILVEMMPFTSSAELAPASLPNAVPSPTARMVTAATSQNGAAALPIQDGAAAVTPAQTTTSVPTPERSTQPVILSPGTACVITPDLDSAARDTHVVAQQHIENHKGTVIILPSNHDGKSRKWRITTKKLRSSRGVADN